MAVMQHAIEDRGSDHGISEHGSPFGDGSVARHEDRSSLVAAGDEVEGKGSSSGLERQVTELIDDEEFWLAVVQELFLKASFAVGARERRYQPGCRNEQRGVAAQDDLSTQGDRQMGFADARRPKQQQAVAVCDPARSSKLADLLRIHRGLRVVVKPIQ